MGLLSGGLMHWDLNTSKVLVMVGAAQHLDLFKMLQDSLFFACIVWVWPGAASGGNCCPSAASIASCSESGPLLARR
eukprot:scaffold171809_cov17-Tisochrysis_lutea.AAC.1